MLKQIVRAMLSYRRLKIIVPTVVLVLTIHGVTRRKFFDLPFGRNSQNYSLIDDEIEIILATISPNSPNTSVEHHYNYGPSLLPAEIERISHFPSQAKIVVQLANKRVCVNPRLFGRLSGEYLSLIHWENKEGTTTSNEYANDKNLITGYYTVPSPGRYFIEIIGILCYDITFDTDFKGICLEDPTRHRLTHSSASIDAVVSVGNKKSKENESINTLRLPLGYWKSSSNVHYPMFTRYQPHDCRGHDKRRTERCINASSVRQFTPYQFVYSDDILINNEEMIHSRATLLDQTNVTNLCLVGGSHSEAMKEEMNSCLRQWNISNVIVHYKESRYPHTTDKKFITQNITTQYCDKIVIAVGQWSAGRAATLFQQYKVEITDMITRFKDLRVANFYLRAIHYNPLGDEKTECPPKDWRSPPVIDMYNDIIQNLSTAMKVPFINTNFIISPMWDSAVDWCHYKFSSASQSEALYMLGQLL